MQKVVSTNNVVDPLTKAMSQLQLDRHLINNGPWIL